MVQDTEREETDEQDMDYHCPLRLLRSLSALFQRQRRARKLCNARKCNDQLSVAGGTLYDMDRVQEGDKAG